MKPVYISIGAIIKNEARYIKEWIEYHKMIGVERFFIIDNGSTDGTTDILQEYITSGLVIYEQMLGVNMQLSAYDKIISDHKNDSKWIAFIDADEFICLKEQEDLKEFLSHYEDANALGINWVCIGPSGHNHPIAGSLIANYKVALPLNHPKNLHIKTILQPQKASGFSYTPHACEYLNGQPAVDENHNLIMGNTSLYDGPTKYAFSTQNHTSKIELLHYYTKSNEEFYCRSMLGKACGEWDLFEVYTEGINIWKRNDLWICNDMDKYSDSHAFQSLFPPADSGEVPELNTTPAYNIPSEILSAIQSGISSILSLHTEMMLSDNHLLRCEQCQRLAILIGNAIEAVLGENSTPVCYLEEYCEQVYQLSLISELLPEHIHPLNTLILKAGCSLL